MNRNVLILAAAISSFIAISANAQNGTQQLDLADAATHLNVGLPTPQLWAGVEVLPMCSDSDPLGANADGAQKAGFTAAEFTAPAPKSKKMKAPKWADGIAKKAGAAKFLMNMVMDQKVSIKVKF